MTRTRLTPWEYQHTLAVVLDLITQVVSEHDQAVDKAAAEKARRTRQRQHLALVS